MSDDPLGALDRAEWLNPPPERRRGPDGLRFVTGARTDFWQSTFYGFRRDDGHALLAPAPGEVEATVAVEAAYRHLYDQAGIMLRRDARNWIKAGIEWSDGVANLSVVVTRDGHSDWSVRPSPRLAGPQTVRMVVARDAVLVRHRQRGAGWTLLRLCPLPGGRGPVRIGPTACTPERAGLTVTVSAFTLAPAGDVRLHEG